MFERFTDQAAELDRALPLNEQAKLSLALSLTHRERYVKCPLTT